MTDRPCALTDHGSERWHIRSKRESDFCYGIINNNNSVIAIELSIQFLLDSLGRTDAALPSELCNQ